MVQKEREEKKTRLQLLFTEKYVQNRKPTKFRK